mmetsp:Transcript_32984/g.38716  ORF Transcript_32984/g.38716 Transcript_32984/m.38716 type:complete len:94 (+) Transcript_32984:278-559(+)
MKQFNNFNEMIKFVFRLIVKLSHSASQLFYCFWKPLQCTSNELENNPSIVLEAMKQHNCVFESAPNKVRRDLMMKLIRFKAPPFFFTTFKTIP